MPSLVDIAPPELSAEEVDIRGTKLKVQGIAGEGWMTLYARHPVMRAIVSGRTDGLSTFESLASQVALIAAGLGNLHAQHCLALNGDVCTCSGDVETERLVLDRLTVDEHRQVVEVIMKLSMPGHIFGPLLDGGGADTAAAHSTEGLDTK